MAHYPRFIPRPKGRDVNDKIIVKNETEHERKNPDDFQAFQDELNAQKLLPERLSQAAMEERERCAMIAESMERGNKLGIKIAAAIRKAEPPKEKEPVVAQTKAWAEPIKAPEPAVDPEVQAVSV